MDKAVENNILKLFKEFYEKPAIFLSESDVMCYLYSLLINDPVFKISPTLKYFSSIMESSETSLVHAEMQVNIKNRNKIVDISIFPPERTLDYSDLTIAIGIEIKYNRRAPARKEPSSIIEDIKKVSDYKKGYILWLNYDREISDDHLEKVEKIVEKYENVKLYYLDIFSEPMKTNVKEISSI